MNQTLILVGAGGHARACIDVIEAHGKYTIKGLIGDAQELGQKVMGYPILGTDGDLPELVKDYPNALITVGQVSRSTKRKDLYKVLLDLGFHLPTIISPSAYVAKSAQIGLGTIVMHHALLNTQVSIGNNCIINSKALIEHDVKLGDHSHVATAAVLNGAVCVGEHSFIGSGSVICQGVEIPVGSFLPMGSVIKSSNNICL